MEDEMLHKNKKRKKGWREKGRQEKAKEEEKREAEQRQEDDSKEPPNWQLENDGWTQKKKCDRVLNNISISSWFKLVRGDFPCKDQTMTLIEPFEKQGLERR